MSRRESHDRSFAAPNRVAACRIAEGKLDGAVPGATVALALLIATCALLFASGSAQAADTKVRVSDPCRAGRCEVTVTVVPTVPTRLELSLDHRGDASSFRPTMSVGCAPPASVSWQYVDSVCRLGGKLPARPGVVKVAWRVLADGASGRVQVKDVRVEGRRRERPSRERPSRRPAVSRDGAEVLCEQAKRGDKCQPGGGRRVPGGGEKVSHKGWPSITGVFWQVTGNRGRRFVGGAKNDELLGHHGSDRIAGAGGNDVIWGDWDPKNNNTWQKDVLRGGSGNDWIYSSHGHNRIYGGPGRDYIWAYYGRGTIDCGPGKNDTARVRLNSAYRVRNCERIKNFCGHGSKPGGGCYKPGEKPATRRRTR
jgi:hypothetical protein